MNKNDFKRDKALIRGFLQSSYSDKALVRFLEQGRTGAMPFMDSDKCLIGMSDAGYHYTKYNNSEARAAESAFCTIVRPLNDRASTRARIVVPIILAEIRRRSRAQMASSRVVESETSPVLQEA